MTRVKTFTVVLLVIPLVSFMVNSVEYVRNKTAIRHLTVLSPVTFLVKVYGQDREKYDDSISQISLRHLSRLVTTEIPDSVEKGYIRSGNDSTVSNLVWEIENQVKNSNTARKLKVPQKLIDLCSDNHSDYLLYIYHSGFKRTEHNLKDQTQVYETANFFWGVHFRPYKYCSVMSCCLIDVKQSNILYYKRAVWPDRDPTDDIVIKSQLNFILKRYFM